MMKSYTVDIDGIGPVLFEKSKRAKHIIISVRTSKVRVAVPIRVSFNKALVFVYHKKEWIQKILDKFTQYDKPHNVYTDIPLPINKASAKTRLIDRLSYIANKHGFKYNNVSIREQRTRWGSCSHNNNISLNMKLVLLPKELIDYVILHELVHTRIRNHSKEFWTSLDRYTGNAKFMSKCLRMNDWRLL